MGNRFRVMVVAAACAVWSMAPAVVTATGSNPPTMGTTIRDASNTVIAQAQWNKTPFHIHVLVSGSLGTPTGTVKVLAYTNGTCAGSGTALPTLTLTNGTTNSPDYLGSAIGAVSYKATYNGNGTYTALTGGCKQLTIIKQKPVVTTKVRDSSGTAGTVFPVGEPVHDSGTVTGVNATPTDAVEIHAYSDGTCTTQVGLTSFVALSNGTFNAGFSKTYAQPGVRSFRADYPGDTHFQAVTGACEPFTIKGSPTIKTTVFNGNTAETTIRIGTGKVIDHVAVTGSFGTPTGNVFAQLFTNGSCTGMPTYQSQDVTLASGKAEIGAAFGTQRLPDPGAYSFKVFYLGNGTYLKGTGTCESFTMVKSDVSVARIALSDGTHDFTSLAVGQSAYPYVTLRVPAGMLPATGTITVVSLAAQCQGVGVSSSAPLDHGTARLTSDLITPTTTGSIWLSFSYSGDALYRKTGLGCVEVPVTAAPVTPAPGATSPPLVVTTPAPGSTEAPGATAGASGLPDASASAGPSESAAVARPGASSAPGGSAAADASLSPTGADTGASGSVSPLLLIAIIAIVLLIAFEAMRQRRRPKQPA